MNYSTNLRVLALYSGIIGAYLQLLNSNYIPNEQIINQNLLQVTYWLISYNPYLRNYTNIIHQKYNTPTPNPFPTTTHIPNDDIVPLIN